MPLQIAPRSGNIPIKTITVSTPNSGSLDGSNIHRNLSGSNTANLQATTIMPIAKIVSQQQQQNLSSVSAQGGNQSTPVFIQTRINAPSTISSSTSSQSLSQVVTVSTPTSVPSGFSSGSTTVYYEPASVTIAPSSIGAGSGDQTKTTSASSASNNDSSSASSSYTVVAPNVRYSEKIIHSIIANSFQQQQQQNTNNANQSSSIASNQSQSVRYSPLVVENQSSVSSSGQNQSQQHQIITMAPGTIIQQTSSQAAHHQQQQQHHGLSVEAIAANILSSLPSSSHAAMRKNETTPVKMTKKATKVIIT